jgi:hypothetical protein
VPLRQESEVVQRFPSSHSLPSKDIGFVHAPVADSHVPASWQPSIASHTKGDPAAHAPDWQVSATVQASPSLHAEPSEAIGFEHAPVALSQVPALWH